MKSGPARLPKTFVSRFARSAVQTLQRHRAHIRANESQVGGPAYRERTRGFHRDELTYRWQHVASGRIVSRTKLEMREEHGPRHDSLDCLVAGRIQISRGWRLAPQPCWARGRGGSSPDYASIGTAIRSRATQTPSLTAYTST